MEVQAELGSDIALVFDECTPYHADREYTARSMERTHRWLDRCLEWHERDGPERQAVFGIVQGGVHEDLRRESAQARLRGRRSTGSRSAAPSAATRRRCAGVLGADRAAAARARRPKHLLGIGEVDDLLGRHRPRPRRLRLRRSRPASPATASPSSPTPSDRFRLDLRKAGWEGNREPLVEGCPCPACTHHDRDYLSYLSRAEELTAVRLLCLHNLTYLHELMTHARRRSRPAPSAPTAPRSSPARRPAASV